METRMVDVGDKTPQRRSARASGRIDLSAETVALISDKAVRKGDVLTVAEIAGIQAAKRTDELIPLCHPLELTKVDVDARLEKDGVAVTAVVECVGRTGVEMEALTAVSAALLTVYDMCKAVDKKMRIREVVLEEKTKRDA
ncbi:MAG: cyclic pyranopterin monophosphate synthase MoaC [Planctomycetota bacterium]